MQFDRTRFVPHRFRGLGLAVCSQHLGARRVCRLRLERPPSKWHAAVCQIAGQPVGGKQGISSGNPGTVRRDRSYPSSKATCSAIRTSVAHWMANLLYREPGSLSGKLELEEHGRFAWTASVNRAGKVSELGRISTEGGCHFYTPRHRKIS
jgi:hypothetical protein